MKSALLFPGQGSQYSGMGKSLYHNFAEARAIFEEANEALNVDIRKLCFEGGKKELADTVNTQPAILTVSIAAYQVYRKEIGAVPAFVAGHSLGEYSALVCSEALSLTDALKLVIHRGQIMQDSAKYASGAMYVIFDLKREYLEQVCQEVSRSGLPVVISCYNSTTQTIISGHRESVEQVIQKLERLKVRCRCLNQTYAFHSPLMQKAVGQMREELEKYTFAQGKYPVISNVTAMPYESDEQILDLLPRQITSPVRWSETIAYLLREGVSQTIELGPKTVLSQLLRDQTQEIVPSTLGSSEDVHTLKNKLGSPNASSPQRVQQGLAFIAKCLAYAVSTRNHNGSLEEYEQGVTLPYRKIKAYQQQVERNNESPSLEHMHEAFDMLRSVLTTKKVPEHKQREILQQLLEETQTKVWFTQS